MREIAMKSDAIPGWFNGCDIFFNGQLIRLKSMQMIKKKYETIHAI
jgi:hypothetical protein